MLIPVFIASDVYKGPRSRVIAVAEIPPDELGHYADTDRPYRLYAIEDVGAVRGPIHLHEPTTDTRVVRLIISSVRKRVRGAETILFHYATIRHGDAPFIRHVACMTDLQEKKR